MSVRDEVDEGASNRRFTAPYSSHHPVPSVQKYEERQHHHQEQPDTAGDDGNHESGIQRVKNLLNVGRQAPDDSSAQDVADNLYNSLNRNAQPPAKGETSPERDDSRQEGTQRATNKTSSSSQAKQQNFAEGKNPRQKCKNMKHIERDHEGRVVTDPVTHLPVTIHDSTEKELNNVPTNLPPPGSDPWMSTSATKNESSLQIEQEEGEAGHRGMEKLFPPPNFQAMKEQMIRTYNTAIAFGLGSVMTVCATILTLNYLTSSSSTQPWANKVVSLLLILIGGLGPGVLIVWFVQGWLRKKCDALWDDEVWSASRAQERQFTDSPTPESTQWLNSLLASVWPLINPDLFTSLADTLEDVMQASLPKMVRVVSVEDIGQGSEALRILGVRWLTTGAAAQNVSIDGKIQSQDRNHQSDRAVPDQGDIDDDAEAAASNVSQKGSKPSKEQDQNSENEEENIAEGMEAEEGDFFNVEVAFAYRVSNSGKGFTKKVKNAHLYLAFYLPGGLRFPIWVELRGIVGTMRLRLQLCPDPPFFSLCTLTLLGQPKANISCVPLTKHFLNIMDLPIISSFVQSSIDAALAEYVAPKSLTLDLKDMLVGDDFKKDTHARGVLMVHIKRAEGFKEGDGGIGILFKGSADPFVSVGWAKFGKPVWSTRVIPEDMKPVWDETTYIIVGAEELNAQERLLVQLWDSDRSSADDDLGKIEVDLKELMHDSRSSGKMRKRQDGLQAMNIDKKMPGTLEWSVGYFPKLSIQEEQLARQTAEPKIKNLQQLKDKVSEEATKKLREVAGRDVSSEMDQQKAQGYQAREDSLIVSSPPSLRFLTGVLSIQIHNITGLQLERLNRNNGEGDEADETEDGPTKDLPSSYCTIILNHQKIYETRTKPKNAHPFFNAATECVIRNWEETEVMIATYDSRVHEDHPVLGIVYLPLSAVFHDRCQTNESYPMAGGIGHGRVRISMVFRSVELQAPRELSGWNFGTLEITDSITTQDLPKDLLGLRLKLRTSINHGKMYDPTSDGVWTAKKDRPVRLAVRKRYCSCVIIEFRKHSLPMDKTVAFAIFWLKDIPDDEERRVVLPVWQGDDDLKRAETNCLTTMGEQVGSITVSMTHWHGLGSYHHALAKHNPTLKSVMELLEIAHDSSEITDSVENVSTSSSEDSSDEEGEGKSEGTKRLEEDGSRRPVDQIKEYKAQHKQLHRRHRGIMQWKAPRTAQWVKTKLDHGKDLVLDVFKHHDKNPGVETEV